MSNKWFQFYLYMYRSIISPIPVKRTGLIFARPRLQFASLISPLVDFGRVLNNCYRCIRNRSHHTFSNKHLICNHAGCERFQTISIADVTNPIFVGRRGDESNKWYPWTCEDGRDYRFFFLSVCLSVCFSTQISGLSFVVFETMTWHEFYYINFIT